MGGGSSKGGGGSVNLPKPPKFDKAYGQGVDVYLSHLDQLLGSEQSSRDKYDPQRIQEQQGLQNQYGPEQYREQLSALNQLDPTFMRNRQQLGDTVASDLQRGTALSPSQSTQIQQEVRGAQSARGNIYGDAPAIAEAYTMGDRGQQLYQQRLQNAAGFVGMPTLATQVGQVSPVAPDRNSAYADPNAGFQGVNAANARYQAVASAAAAKGSGGNSGGGWGSTIGGVLGGVVGAYFGGPAGAQGGYTIGSGVGGQIGSSFSDERLKTDIKKVGEDRRGVNIYEFAYKGPKHVGYLAQEVQEVDPGAVHKDPATGYLKVSNEYAPVQIGA